VTLRGVIALTAAAAAAWPAGASDVEESFPINPAAIDDLTPAQITPCNGNIHWSPQLEPASELDALAANPSVRRSGKRLRIGKVTYVNKQVPPEVDNGIGFTFMGRYRAAPLLLVAVAQYETYAWRLVDPKSGQHSDAAGFPLPGPGGHVFAAATRSDGYNEPGLQIIEWRDGRFSGVNLEAAYPCDLVWRGQDELSFRLRVGETAEWLPARAVRKDGAWAIEGP
jgi:hypothetical protein